MSFFFSSFFISSSPRTPRICVLSRLLSFSLSSFPATGVVFIVRVLFYCTSFSLSSPTHSKKRSNQEKKRKSTPKCQMFLSQPPPPCSSSFPASRSNGDLRGLAAPSSPLPFHAAVAFAACAKEEDGRGALACATRGGGRAPPARAPPPPPPPPSRSPALSSPPPLPPLTPHTISSITFSTSALQHLSLLFKDELGLCRGKGRRDLPRRCRRSERAVAAHRAGLAVLRFLSLFFFPLSPRA